MTRHTSRNVWIIFVLAIILAGGIYLITQTNRPFATNSAATISEQTKTSQSLPLENMQTESIVQPKMVAITDPRIIAWFQTSSGLCDEFNIESDSKRKDFCTNKTVFAEMTRVVETQTAPDTSAIGFTIASDALTPDTVAGIYFPKTDTLSMLTSYYLGNRFNGFSPKGTYFVYTTECFEAKCAVIIQDTKTRTTKSSINTETSADARTANATFVRWISDTVFEYRLGEQTYTRSL